MNKEKTFYELLDLDINCSEEQIKRQYYKKVKECHPDVNQKDKNAEENFKKVVKAYEILKDPISRRQYDLGRSEGAFEEGLNSYDREREQYMREREGGKYYENKWYQYQKPSYESQWDEYGKFTQEEAEKERQRIKQKIMRKFAGLVILIIGVDILYELAKLQHQKVYRSQKQLVIQDNLNSPLQSYLISRQMQHQVLQ